jgi:hypothetical protein
VLPDADTAARSVAEFNFEDDATGLPRAVVARRLDPRLFYSSDERLDFALVGVETGAGDRDRFPPLRLLGVAGKSVVGDSVTIIQHPEGREKQVALRSNEIIDVLEDFLQYETDTAPGASGSPVFNDQWEVVALHHSGVPATDAAGNILAIDGTVWNAAMGDAQIRWVANEGVRISRIVQFLANAGLPADGQQLISSIISREASMPDAPQASVLLPQSTFTPPRNGDAAPWGSQPAASGATAVVPDGRLVLQVPSRLELTIQIVAQPEGTAASPAPAPESLGAGVPVYEGWIGNAWNAAKHGVSSAAHGVAHAATSAASTVSHVVSSAAGGVANAASDAVDWAKDKAEDVISGMLPGGGPPPPLPAAPLVAGDVLLYQGNSIVSKGIMLLTNSDVSHAGLYLGGDVVGEALGSGLVKRSTRESFDGANWVIARRLPRAADMRPVLARGEFYLNQRLALHTTRSYCSRSFSS